jgi:hypothetical protein
MSTTMRITGLITRGEPLRHRAEPTAGIWQRIVGFLGWAAARPTLTAASLVLVYLATLGALVAVLMASAVGTLVGTAVLVLFAAELLVFLAIAVYVVIPER